MLQQQGRQQQHTAMTKTHAGHCVQPAKNCSDIEISTCILEKTLQSDGGSLNVAANTYLRQEF